MVHVAKAAAGGRSGNGQDAAHRWAELVEHISSHGRLLRRALGERVVRHGLNDSQFSILWACLKAPQSGLAQNELAAELGLSAAHVSGQVEQLRDRGLLDGERGQRDRRRQMWRLSAGGHELLQQLLRQLDLATGTMAELVHDPAWHDVLRMISALTGTTNTESIQRRMGAAS